MSDETATKKATSSAKLSVDDLLAAIGTMTILELNDLVKAMEEKFGISAAAPVAVADLVKAMEEKFGISAAAPVAVAAAPAAGAADAAPVEEKDSFNVVLTDAGANKINIIKLIRKFNQALGLKEAKDLAESAPKAIAEAVKKPDAEAMKKEFEDAGAKVELQ